MHDKTRISVSVVSHGQGALVMAFLSDLQKHCGTPIEVILTLNIKEILPFNTTDYHFPIKIVRNVAARGFGANHNAAFRFAKADYFCVLNPDIRLKTDPFPRLVEQLANPLIGVVAPLIVNPSGRPENSARRFPTPLSILKKVLSDARDPEYAIGEAPVLPDWVGGMFMVFRSVVFQEIGGFDDRYFLYYEDVDLCWRLRRQGYQTALIPLAHVVHDARRMSHRNIRYLSWHVSSMVRFFLKRAFSSKNINK
jgi:GT2 family glycosyltransferase